MNQIAIADYGPEEAAMRTYLRDGERRAFALGNRGPMRFTADGAVHPGILEAYWRCGFYVFEGVLKPDELADIEADVHAILDRLPAERNATADARGRPALGAGLTAPTLFWAKPLGDPFGGTSLAGGRHPVKMYEPQAAADAPKEVVYLILGSLQFSEASLRVYGHPGLLAVAAAINGPDFAPFNEALWIKEPGRGASVAWHQDGVTHWNSPDWDQGSHGFNFMAQLYGCTPANGVWVVPGSHKWGKADIRAMVAEAGSERLPDAMPIVCKPGDVAITNRQARSGPSVRWTVAPSGRRSTRTSAGANTWSAGSAPMCAFRATRRLRASTIQPNGPAASPSSRVAKCRCSLEAGRPSRPSVTLMSRIGQVGCGSLSHSPAACSRRRGPAAIA